MSSIFDTPEFNERLFFARATSMPAPEGARDGWVPVSGGARLHARVYEPAHARVALLFFHGNGEVVSDYDGYARELGGDGVRMAVVDYRGYGQSTGTPTFRAALDDVAPVIDALGEALEGGAVPLVVMGRSLGGACAVEALRVRRARVAGIVLESAGADLPALVRRRGLEPPRELSVEERARFDPCEKLRGYDGPLLVLHGAGDTLIEPREGRMLYDAAPAARRTLVLVEGRGHNDVLFHPAYWRALRGFLAEIAGDAPGAQSV